MVGPPPPSSDGVHIIQMLDLLEGFDIASMGFGSPDSLHLIFEVLKMAFAGREAVTAEPDFIDVPMERLLSKAYAEDRRPDISISDFEVWAAGLVLPASPNTTHVTADDGGGNIVTVTQTIESTFGARVIVPVTGVVRNNYMFVFDSHPGKNLPIASGRRVTTSISPIIPLRKGKPILALGLPGGLRVFGCAMQALVNKFDYGMSVQEMVEAPRIWTQGHGVETEDDCPKEQDLDLANKVHMMGASFWLADSAPVGLSGGYPRKGARFWLEQVGR